MSTALLPAEVAEQLGCPESYVRKQARTEAWPHSRVGRRIVFQPSHLVAILQLVEHRPAQDTDSSRAEWIELGFSPRSAARQRRSP